MIMIGALAVALLAGGCGSDSSGASAEITVETGSLPKAAFVKRVDAICKEEKAQAIREYRDFARQKGQAARSSPETEQEAALEIIETILAPNFEGLIDQVEELGAPRGDEQQLTTFLRALQRNIEEAQADPVKSVNGLSSPFKQAAQLADKYGLAGCAGALT
jgi:hypothetical protein